MSNENAVIKRNRLFGIIIILIIFIPMALAYIMFHTGLGVSTNTTNKGVLLNPPLALKDLPLLKNDTTLKVLFDKGAVKRWRLLVPVTMNCNEVCQKNLYTTRQVHVRLAEKAYRVERVLLTLGTLSPQLKQDLQNNHPNVIRVKSTKTQLNTWLGLPATTDASFDNYYLIDQAGFAMMRYSAENSGQDLLDDIKKLLKFTYEETLPSR